MADISRQSPYCNSGFGCLQRWVWVADISRQPPYCNSGFGCLIRFGCWVFDDGFVFHKMKRSEAKSQSQPAISYALAQSMSSLLWDANHDYDDCRCGRFWLIHRRRSRFPKMSRCAKFNQRRRFALDFNKFRIFLKVGIDSPFFKTSVLGCV